MFCTGCGAKLAGGAKFCISCGQSVGAAVPVPASQAAAPAPAWTPVGSGGPAPLVDAPTGRGTGITLLLVAATLLMLAVVAIAGYFVHDHFYGDKRSPWGKFEDDMKVDRARSDRKFAEDLEKQLAETEKWVRQYESTGIIMGLGDGKSAAGLIPFEEGKSREEMEKKIVEIMYKRLEQLQKLKESQSARKGGSPYAGAVRDEDGSYNIAPKK